MDTTEEELSKKRIISKKQHYEPAGAGKRILAFLIDYYFLLALLGVWIGLFDVGIESAFGIGLILFWFAYFCVRDGLVQGRGLGKALLNLMVVDYANQEKPCTISQSIKRNFFMIIGLFALIALIQLLTNDSKRRIGDGLAGTIVIDLGKTKKNVSETKQQQPLFLWLIIIAIVAASVLILSAVSNWSNPNQLTEDCANSTNQKVGEVFARLENRSEKIDSKLTDIEDNNSDSKILTESLQEVKDLRNQNLADYSILDGLISESLQSCPENTEETLNLQKIVAGSKLFNEGELTVIDYLLWTNSVDVNFLQLTEIQQWKTKLEKAKEKFQESKNAIPQDSNSFAELFSLILGEIEFINAELEGLTELEAPLIEQPTEGETLETVEASIFPVGVETKKTCIFLHLKSDEYLFPDLNCTDLNRLALIFRTEFEDSYNLVFYEGLPPTWEDVLFGDAPPTFVIGTFEPPNTIEINRYVYDNNVYQRLFHESVHALLRDYALPWWFEEGLAEYGAYQLLPKEAPDITYPVYPQLMKTANKHTYGLNYNEAYSFVVLLQREYRRNLIPPILQKMGKGEKEGNLHQKLEEVIREVSKDNNFSYAKWNH